MASNDRTPTGWIEPQPSGINNEKLSNNDVDPVGWQAPTPEADITRIDDEDDADTEADPEPRARVADDQRSTRLTEAMGSGGRALETASQAWLGGGEDAVGIARPAGETQGSTEPTRTTGRHEQEDDTRVSGERVSRETITVVPSAKEMEDRDPDLRPRKEPVPDMTAPATITTPTDTPIAPPAQPRIMTIANQKGGVGKTTTTVNIAAALATGGLQVLVIDMDPQGNASTALGIDHRGSIPSIYDVVVDEAPIETAVVECPDIPGLWCVPATIDLAGAEIELVPLVARENRLRRALEEFLAQRHFDYVLIDCPPSLGLLTVNAFVAGSEVFIPIQCEYYALEGLSQLIKNVELIRRHLNPDLHISTILLTMYDARTRLSAQVAEEVRAHFPDQVLATRVPRSVRISEAPSFGQTVISYDPTSTGALAYSDAAREIGLRGQ